MRKVRKYNFIIGKPIILPDDYFIAPLARGNTPVLSLENYYEDNRQEDAFSYSNHEMSFRVVKTEGKNSAEVTLHNLPESTLNYLLSNRDNNLVVMLKVGYDNDLKLLFQGVMKDCTPTKNGTTSYTKITIGDGDVNMKNAYTSRTYPKGTQARTIVKDLIGDLATPEGHVVELPQTAVLPAPISLFGNTSVVLNRFLSSYDYVMTINNGMCYAMPSNQRLQNNVAYISRESGLIGRVQPLVVDKKTNNITNQDTNGFDRIRFTCQMDATIEPMSSVYVKDETVNVDGAYRVEKAAFIASSFESGSWIVTVDAVKIDATISRT